MYVGKENDAYINNELYEKAYTYLYKLFMYLLGRWLLLCLHGRWISFHRHGHDGKDGIYDVLKPLVTVNDLLAVVGVVKVS